MKPVDQTKFGMPAGNCLAACVASVLEMPLADVPAFDGTSRPDDNWWLEFQDWLHARGMFAVELKLEGRPSICLPERSVYVILTGKSPRGDFAHAVVGRSDGDVFRLAHDPHPSRAGIVGNPTWVMFLCRLI
jgi:hypothetical protein